ncbi:unnamed protein product [Rhodiola kirilowii]
MDSEDFITLPDTREAGEIGLTSPSLDLPNGNHSKSVVPEAVTFQEGPIGDDFIELGNEAEPQTGSARDMVRLSSISEEGSLFSDSVIVPDNVNNLNSATPIGNGDLSYRGKDLLGLNYSKSVEPEAVKCQEGPNGDDSIEVGSEAKPQPGSARDLVGFKSISQEASLFGESVIVPDNVKNLNSPTPIENGDLTYRVTTGAKRSRVTSDVQTSSVHVIFSSLTRQSKQKLEALLQQWSAWDAKHCSSPGSNEMCESGEATYYPALHVGLDKSSTVSFWLDNQTSKNKEVSQMDDEPVPVPVYDRGYALALTSGDGYSNFTRDSEVVDDSRCFNCGSYNHSLRECPKPRDNAAVKNARKQHKSKRNQNPNSRTPTRYYQSTPSGKYDGLRPGVLEAETRKLLGLGELDPPPWLDRMREIGYPPGYLEDDEGEPSGITIFGEEENKVLEEEKEDGEIQDMEQDMELSPPPELPKLPKKMSVDFPGINTPIPANADKRLWAPASSTTDSFSYRSSRRFDYPSVSISRDHFRESRWSRDSRDDGPPGVESRWSRDSRDDGPPGVESRWSRDSRDDGPLGVESRWSRDSRDDGPPGVGASVYSYSSRYASYNPTDSFQSPRRESHHSRSSSFERSERDRTSPTHHENAHAHESYHSQSYGSRSSRSVYDDLRKYAEGRDPYSENSAPLGHREGRENRHRRT